MIPPHSHRRSIRFRPCLPGPEEHARDKELIERAIKSRSTGSYEQRFLRPDGRIGYYFSTFSGIYDNDGNLTAMKGVVQDITARRVAETALRDSEERYRNFVANASEGIYRIDLEPPVPISISDQDLISAINERAVVGEVNDALARMYGMSPADMVGRSAVRFAPDYGRRALLAVRADRYQVNEVETIDRRADGQPLYLAESYTAVVEGGMLVRIWGMQRDITDRKKTERERKELEAQLHQSQKLEAVGQLAGGIAHDFNNILTAILGNAQLSLMGVESELGAEHQVIESVKQIEEAAQRAAGLTRQLLTFSRRDVRDPQTLDLNAVISGLDSMLRRLISESIRFVTHLDEQPCLVRADASHMEQVVVNLVVNAGHAMPEGGSVTLATRHVRLDDVYVQEHAAASCGPHVLLTVQDTGFGMNAETRERIFEPFFTTKDVGKGTGLGLATVHGIVKQCGGHIVVDSEVGSGTTFNIYLPELVEVPTG